MYPTYVLKAISLYTGVGGLDFGFEAAGFETSVAVELDAAACQTIRLNRDWPILEGDIHGIKSQEILDAAGLRRGEADVLIGGPPCQPFSKSSYWINGDSSRLDDPASGTLDAYLRVLRDTQPKAFLLENVHGLAYEGKDEGLQYLIREIARINDECDTDYTINWDVLNAVNFGVPQKRERVFVIGARNGAEFAFPAATHHPAEKVEKLGGKHEPFRTCWDAIGDMTEFPNEKGLQMTGKWADLLSSIPEGRNYLWHTRRGGGMPLFGWRTRYWSFLLKLSKSQPSWTIQAQPGSAIGPFHWRNRKLATKELCRLQTFPDGLEFDCGRTDVQRMIGNAVPSLLGEILAREMRSQLLHSPLSKGLKLIPPVLRPIPEAEPTEMVPPKYHQLAGDHDDHPGTGRGRRARQQWSSFRQTSSL